MHHSLALSVGFSGWLAGVSANPVTLLGLVFPLDLAEQGYSAYIMGLA
jgi:hypothetical protein